MPKCLGNPVVVNSIRNLGNANAQVFSTPGNIGNETTNAHDERLQLHDIDRLHDVLAALERVTGVDSLNRQSPLARRTRAASAIRDLNKGHTLQQIRGFLITDEDRRSALAHLRGELQTSPAMKKLLLIRAKHMKPAQTTITMLCQPLVRTGTSMGVGEFVVSLIPTIIGPVPERRHCSSVRFARPKVQTGMTFRPIPVQRGIPYPRKCLNRFEKKERS